MSLIQICLDTDINKTADNNHVFGWLAPKTRNVKQIAVAGGKGRVSRAEENAGNLYLFIRRVKLRGKLVFMYSIKVYDHHQRPSDGRLGGQGAIKPNAHAPPAVMKRTRMHYISVKELPRKFIR